MGEPGERRKANLKAASSPQAGGGVVINTWSLGVAVRLTSTIYHHLPTERLRWRTPPAATGLCHRRGEMKSWHRFYRTAFGVKFSYSVLPKGCLHVWMWKTGPTTAGLNVKNSYKLYICSAACETHLSKRFYFLPAAVKSATRSLHTQCQGKTNMNYFIYFASSFIPDKDIFEVVI